MDGPVHLPLRILMKRRFWKFLLLAVVLLALALGGGRWWVSSRVNAAEIVRLLENSRNCRASVGSVSVRLLGFPARVEVRDLVITPRDESQKPAVPGETYIKVNRALLEVELFSLLAGNVDVERILVEGVNMQTVKWEGGGNSLRLLLGPPGTVLRPPAPRITLEDEDEIPAPDAVPGDGEDKPWHISELPVTSTLHEARISNASWTLVNQRRQTVQQWKDCSFVLSGMTLDPANPSAGGSARVTAGTRLILDNQRLRLRSLDFILALEGKYQLVDAATGYLNNDLAFEIAVKKGSLINRIPTLVKLNERLQKLESSIGLGITLPPEATLLSDTVLRARLQDQVIRLTDDVFFPFDTYQLGLDKDSWLSLRDEQHSFTGRLVVAGDISKNAVASLRAYLEKRSGQLATLVTKTVIEKIVTPEGSIELPFKSEAELGSPDVKLSDKLLDAIKRAGAEAGKDLLKDAIEGGDDLENIFDAVKKGLKKDK
jgi:hypothetical protein